MAAVIRRTLLALLLGVLLGSAAWAQQTPVNVDSEGLLALMARGVPLVDIRTAPEWDQTGTIAGAHRITAFDERGKPTPDFMELLGKVAKPGQDVALICRSGARSSRMAQSLTEQSGYAHVYNVERGMNRWLSEGRPVEK